MKRGRKKEKDEKGFGCLPSFLFKNLFWSKFGSFEFKILYSEFHDNVNLGL